MNRIMNTIFTVSLASYLVFALADYVRPGFVSYIFSVHWFLAVAIASGTMLIVQDHHNPRSGMVDRLIGHLTRAFVGLALLIVFWQEGEAFGDFRIFVSCAAFLTPWLISKGKFLAPNS